MHPKRRFVEYAYINDIPSVKEYIFLVIKDNEKICWKEYQETIKKSFNKMYDAFFYAFIGFGDVWLFDKVTRNHKKAEQGKIVLLFMDTSHFVLRCDYLGYLYSRIRKFIRTFSEGKRYNVLGAIDYVTKHIIKVTN